MERMGSVPILPVKWTITIGIMLYFDGDGDRHGNVDDTCKQAFKCEQTLTGGRLDVGSANGNIL